MAALHTFKVRGLTAASATINTQDVEYHDDGSLRFTLATGEKIVIQPDANLNKLLKVIFTGVGGYATGKHLVGA